MAYSESTALRIRDALAASGSAEISEKKMMGGMIFLSNGNMLMGLKTLKDGTEQFMFRVGKDQEAEALAIRGTQPMIHGGRHMAGFLFIDAPDCPEAVFPRLLRLACDYVGSLPPK